MYRFYRCIILFACLCTNSFVFAQKKEAVDTTIKPVYKPKSYNEVIKPSAVTDDGLIKVHKLEDRYYFEIPDSLFDRDIFIVNRIVKGGSEAVGLESFFGYAGDDLGSRLIRFSRGPAYKVFIRDLSNTSSYTAGDSSANGLVVPLANSNIPPIVYSFDIKAFTPDSTGVVLDLTDFINGENTILFADAVAKIAALKVATFQPDKSYIEGVKSFPLNVEMRAVKTFTRSVGNGFATFELNSSLVLLPKNPMKPRLFDQRIGYFRVSFMNFDRNPQGAEMVTQIKRWRMEPKEEDLERYKRGELVEPQKPIVYYIDPATPKKWVPYLIQGVNDWQKAFEKAGFKNAIYAKEAPLNDPEWSLEDARHSAIVYKPSYLKNAMGPVVVDPRSGEIIETHISWYHNVLQLLKDWYFIQVSAIDTNARKALLPDSVMGRLIRYVCSHEVGHTLGLMHNFGASSSVKVENLRNKKWVEEHGISPSIMDYARLNYVAQPEDSIGEKGIMPRIGAYDEWAIEWGYRWFADIKDPVIEKEMLNKWVIERTKDRTLWFGNEMNPSDPRTQSEDLGDDAVKASYYGIKNLKRTFANFVGWTSQPAEDARDFLTIKYTAVFNQFKTYLFHVAAAIGGVMLTPKTMAEAGPVIEYPAKAQQKKALNFLQEYIFTTPHWIMDSALYSRTATGGVYQVAFLQREVLEQVFSHVTLGRLFWWSAYQPSQAYTPQEFFNDLDRGIWKELSARTTIDLYRRNLQKIYTDQLVSLLKPPVKAPSMYTSVFYNLSLYTDNSTLIKQQIRNLIKKIDAAIPAYTDPMSKYHLTDVRDRLKNALNENKN